MVIRTLHAGGLGAIYSPATWNAGLLGGPKELQDFFGWLFFGDADAGEGVVGFDASAASLNVTVKRGTALKYTANPEAKADDEPAGLSKWAWAYSGGNIVKAIGAHDGNPRYDLISLDWTVDTDTTVNVGYRNSTPADTDTQRGSQVALTVTAGTPAGSPTKPATPAGQIALWYVYVPATSGALVLVDARPHLPGPARRPDDIPIEVQSDVGTSEAEMLKVLARKIAQDDTPWASYLRWSLTEDVPVFVRGKGASGDYVGGMYPMMMPTDRRWWLTVPWVGASLVFSDAASLSINAAGGLGTGRSGLAISRGTADQDFVAAYVNIPVQNRSLELVAAKFTYEVTEAFDATIDAGAGNSLGRAVKLYLIKADGSNVELATENLTLTAGSVVSTTMTLSDTPVLAEGDTLMARFVLGLNNDGTINAGELWLFNVRVQFKEGRA